MPRLLRPPISTKTKLRVVLRQLGEMFIEQVIAEHRYVPRETVFMRSWTKLLDHKLAALAELLRCDVEDLRLDHDPALGARRKVFRNGVHVGYVPDANDPEHLIYREKHAHHIKTNVRGDGAQHPDRVLIKKNRRLETGLKKRRGPRIQSRGFSKGPKRSWGKRSLPKRRKTS